MLPEPRYLIGATLIGLGATLMIDGWALLLRRGFNILSLSYCLLGRWLLHMPRGTFVHRSIGAASQKPHDGLLGCIGPAQARRRQDSCRKDSPARGTASGTSGRPSVWAFPSWESIRESRRIDSERQVPPMCCPTSPICRRSVGHSSVRGCRWLPPDIVAIQLVCFGVK